jgi:hypothetical protein
MTAGESPTIAELTLSVEPEAWRRAGFRVEDAAARVGGLRLRLAGEGSGPRISWALRGIASCELDGPPTESSDEPPATPVARHPNGVLRLDHVVAFSGNLERTVASLRAAGLDFRRLREGPTPAGSQRQAFFRLGETILEIAEHPPGVAAAQDLDAPSRFYGLAFLMDDMDAAAASLGEGLGEVRDAVQPGRRIATVKREAGLGLPVAFMTAEKRSG